MSKDKRIISFFVTFAILISILPYPAHGAYTGVDTFWNWLHGESTGIVKTIIGYTAGSVCTKSADGYHHATSYEKDLENGYYTCICTECGNDFPAYASDLETAYDAYVDTLPAPGYTSDGGLIWQPTIYDLFNFRSGRSGASTFFCAAGKLDEEYVYSDTSFRKTGTSSSSLSYNNMYTLQHYVAPIDGYYKIVSPYLHAEIIFSVDGVLTRASYVAYPTEQRLGNAGEVFEYWDELVRVASDGTADLSSVKGDTIFYFYLPTFEITPTDSLATTYTPDSRPSTLTGDYGILGDDGTIIKSDTQYIVDETNSTVYNPVTNTTSNITDWTYDYSDRSYTVTLDDGTTQTITYGDEYITIKEGDTIYNVYYLTDGAGSDQPSTCTHNYTSSITTAPTCITTGVDTYTCSLCGNTYTQQTPATGHTWEVRETVNTTYDENGNLTQQGYTIFKCSVCGEEYKSENGTGPPATPGTGSSGESGGIFAFIFSLFLDFFKFFWDGFTSFVGSGIRSFLDSLMDGASDVFGIFNPATWLT